MQINMVKLIKSEINDTSVVKQQYASADHLNTRISIHDKYSTNKMGFGNWIVSNYRISEGMKVLELGCGTGDMWKNREYIYSLSSMTSLNSVPKHKIKDILMHNLTNGILNVPKEYGMFVAS